MARWLAALVLIGFVGGCRAPVDVIGFEIDQLRPPLGEAARGAVLIEYGRAAEIDGRRVRVSGWGTGARLDDGLILTAGHVLDLSPRRVGGNDVAGVEVVRRPAAASRAPAWPREYASFCDDWSVVRLHGDRGGARGFEGAPARLTIDDEVVVLGYPRDGSTTPPRPTPAVRAIRGRVVAAPADAEGCERELTYVRLSISGDTSGFSGGPVIRLEASGEWRLAGIYLGRFGRTFAGFEVETLGVVQAWPVVAK